MSGATVVRRHSKPEQGSGSHANLWLHVFATREHNHVAQPPAAEQGQ